MKVGYHARVQTDVSEILRRYDAISPRLGDKFWSELVALIQRSSSQPTQFHSADAQRRRANLSRFPYHFLYQVMPMAFVFSWCATTNGIPIVDSIGAD